jgi:hypothetical protein
VDTALAMVAPFDHAKVVRVHRASRLAHSTFRICKPIPMPGALLLYLAYAVWMLGRYRRQEQERRYIIEVLRSQGWRDRLVHWLVTGC